MINSWNLVSLFFNCLLCWPLWVSLTSLCLCARPGVAAAAAAAGGEGVSSHREGRRAQRLQEAAQDKNQRSSALHKDRSDEDGPQSHFNYKAIKMSTLHHGSLCFNSDVMLLRLANLP